MVPPQVGIFVGPPPRVRRNPAGTERSFTRRRSTPARAEKPSRYGNGGGGDGVHPRACGETTITSPKTSAGEGPPPRVRRNRNAHGYGGRNERSTPARAEKPLSPGHEQQLYEVHPRACGETRFRSYLCQHPQGPPPRVRRNPVSILSVSASAGSTPARAEKPGFDPICVSIRRVHPRACGETSLTRPRTAVVRGPPPRVRRNRWTIMMSVG